MKDIACLEDKYKIAEYKTVASSSSQGLDEEVNKLIQNGWEVWGKPYCIIRAQTVAQQVMVRLIERVD